MLDVSIALAVYYRPPQSCYIACIITVLLICPYSAGRQKWYTKLCRISKPAWNHWCMEGKLSNPIPPSLPKSLLYYYVMYTLFSLSVVCRKCSLNLIKIVLVLLRGAKLPIVSPAWVRLLFLSLSLPLPLLRFVHTIKFYVGYELSPTAVSILFNRFARRRKFMQIDDFCACLSRVKIMSGMLYSY